MRLLDWLLSWFRPNFPKSQACLEQEIQAVNETMTTWCQDPWHYRIVEQLNVTADHLYNSLGQEIHGEEFQKASKWIEAALNGYREPRKRAMALRDAMVYIQQGLELGTVPEYTDLDRFEVG